MSSLTPQQLQIESVYLELYRSTSRQIHETQNIVDRLNNRLDLIIENLNTLYSSQRQRSRRTYTNPNTNTNTTNTTSFSNSPLLSALFSQPVSNQEPNLFEVFSNYLPTTAINSRVVVAPTNEQILQSTRVLYYNEIENPLNVSCPISLENFESSHMVTQIIHCGHIFNTPNFNSWFRSNVRCPVCRYDIRDYIPNPSPIPSPNPSVNPEPESNATVNQSQDTNPTPNPSVESSTSETLESQLLNIFSEHATHFFQDSSLNTVVYDFILPSNRRS